MNHNLNMGDVGDMPDIDQEQEPIEILRQLSCEEIAYWLHLIFFNFTVPAPSLEDINRIVLLYQESIGRNSMEMKTELIKVCQLEGILRRFEVVVPPQEMTGVLPPFRSRYVKNALSAFLHPADDGSVSNRTGETNSTCSFSNHHVSCPLPQNCLVCTEEAGSSPVVRLLASDPHECLFLLPKSFQLAFFRIFIRLFTNDDDVKYRQYYEYGIEDDLLDQTLHEPVVERFNSCLEKLKLKSVKQDPKENYRRSSMESRMSARQSSVYSSDDIFSVCSDGGKFYGWGTPSGSSLPASHEGKKITSTSPPGSISYPETTNLHTDTYSYTSDKSSQKLGSTYHSPDSILDTTSNALYCVVRFRCAPAWNNYVSDMADTSEPQDTAVDCVAKLVECVMSGFSRRDSENSDHLIGPICRMLGLLCMAGMGPRILKRILFLVSEKDLVKEEGNCTPIKNAMKLYLTRALETAATTEEPTGCDQKIALASSPSEFFIYNGEGSISLSAMMKQSAAPFVEAFGFSVSFRLDPKPFRTKPSLFAFYVGDERSLSASFEAVGLYDFILVVKVQHNLNCPILLPLLTHRFTLGRWYHVAIQHGSTNTDTITTLTSRPECKLEVYVDGVLALAEDVAYPFGHCEGEESLEPQIELGRNLIGQTSALRLFNKKVSASTIKALHMFDFGTLKEASKHQPLAAKNGSTIENILFTPLNLHNHFLSNSQFMIWSPFYTNGNMVIEHARGWHGSFPKLSISSWAKPRVQDTILSIGGVQMLLPLFQMIVPENLNKHSRQGLGGLLPCLLSLLSSLLRNHDTHSITILKYKGISLVERYIAESDQKAGLSALKRSMRLSTDTVNSVLALYYAASSCNTTLQLEVRSRLLFNASLWLDNSHPGDVFFSAYLPLFSFVARSLPGESLLSAIDLSDTIVFLPNLISASVVTGAEEEVRWHDGSGSCNSKFIFLTSHQLHHIAEVIFMMVAATCAEVPLPCCLHNFLSYLLRAKAEEYNFRNFALASAALVSLSLTGKTQPRLKNAFDYSKDLAGWIIAGIENSCDDFVNAVYIRCIHAYCLYTHYKVSGVSSRMFKVLKKQCKSVEEFSYSAIMAFFIECEQDERVNEHFMFSRPFKNAEETSLGCGFTLHTKTQSLNSDMLSFCHFGCIEMIEQILDLARGFSDTLVHRFLKDFWQMLESRVTCSENIWKSRNCQETLFFLISDAISDCMQTSTNSKVDQAENSFKILVAESRMELAAKIYGKLLGNCLRSGGEEAFHAIEIASSLQHLTASGENIFTCILCYVFKNLRQEGLLHSEETKDSVSALRCDAEILIKSILMKGTKYLDFTSANVRWECLRHLIGLAAGVVSANGFCTDILMVEESFRKCNGLDFDVDAPLSLSIAVVAADNKECCHYETIAVASQALLVTDSFFALHSSTSSVEVSTALALTGSYDSRLGVSQGPLISSIIRLSFILLVMLDPYNAMFGPNLFRLRLCLRWCSILSYQSSDAQQNLLSRIFVSSVYLLYIASQKCAALLQGGGAVLGKGNHRQILLLNGEKLRGILSEMFKDKNELLRCKLPKAAFESMKSMFGQNSVRSKKHTILQLFPKTNQASVNAECAILAFMHHASFWSQAFCSFHNGSTARPTLIEELSMESSFIINEFKQISLDVMLKNTDVLKGREIQSVSISFSEKGCLNIEPLLERYECYRNELKLLYSWCTGSVVLLRDEVLDFWADTTNCWRSTSVLHWKWPDWDSTYGRILLIQNKYFDAHERCAYEPLGKHLRQPTLSKRISMGLIKRASMAFHSEPVNPVQQSFSHEKQQNMDEDYMTAHQSNDKQHQLDEVDPIWASYEDTADVALKQYGIESQDGENILLKVPSVIKVSLGRLQEGEFLITNKYVYFRERNAKAKEAGTKKKDLRCETMASYKWKISFLLDFHLRKYLLQDCGLAFLFMNNSSAFFSFDSKKARDNVHDLLRKLCKTPLIRSEAAGSGKWITQLQGATELWRKRRMSNFDYLVHLNVLAGRSLFDLSQYPVMPWVLADWTSEILDLKNSQVFRDLSKPIGTLNPDRLSTILERYSDQDSFEGGQSFMYGSLYSSPGIVLYFMLRTEPFTTLSIELQSGKFDRPDRLFSSMLQAWTSSLQSTTDFKELIPELFTSPEILLNCNRFNFGKTQEGRLVDHVELPPWADGCAHQFIRLHRMALESEYVGNNLHHWIDLIFGYKQRGKAAVQANNVFHFLSYDGYDIEAISDPSERQAAKSFIENFGCIPRQLFSYPHPSRCSIDESFVPFYSELFPQRKFCCYVPPSQFGGSIYAPAKGSVLNVTFVTDNLLVVYSDLHVGSYRVLNLEDSFVVAQEKLQKLQSNCINRDSMPGPHPYLIVAVASVGRHQAQASNTFQSVQPKRLSKHLPRAGMAAVRSLSKKILLKSSSSVSVTSMDSVFLLSCDYFDNAVKVHSAEALHLEYKCNWLHRGAIKCIAVGDNGVIVTGGEDATCRVWILDRPEMATALLDSTMPDCFSDVIERLACVHVLWGHQSSISSVCVSSALDVVISGGTDGSICVHRALSGDFVRFIDVGSTEKEGRPNPTRKRGIRRVAINKWGLLVIHTEDGMLHKGTVNGAILLSIEAHDLLNALEISLEGETVVSGGENGHLLARSMRDLSVIYKLDFSMNGPIEYISFSPMNSMFSKYFLCVGSNNGTLALVYPDVIE